MGGGFRGSLITKKLTQQKKNPKKIKHMVSKAFGFTQWNKLKKIKHLILKGFEFT